MTIRRLCGAACAIPFLLVSCAPVQDETIETPAVTPQAKPAHHAVTTERKPAPVRRVPDDPARFHISKVFNGRVERFDPETGEISLIYDFEKAAQLADWRSGIAKYTKSEVRLETGGERSVDDAVVEGGWLHRTNTATGIGVMHAAEFAGDVEFSATGGPAFGYGGGPGVLYYSPADSRHYYTVRFTTEADKQKQWHALLSHGLSYSIAKEIVPFAYKTNRPVTHSLTMKDETLSYAIDGRPVVKNWTPVHKKAVLQRNRPLIRAFLVSGSYGPKAGFDDVRIKGTLRKEWLEAKKREFELMAALRDKDAAARLKAARALYDIAQHEAVESLTAALKKESDAAIREELVRTLGKISDARTVEPLAACLRDGDPVVRRRAVLALGRREDESLADPLAKTLEDTDEQVRICAAVSLGRIGDTRALPHLLKLLDDENDKIRRWAARGLGRIGDGKALKPLLALLEDDSHPVRAFAAEAVGKLGDADQVPALTALKKDTNAEVRRAVSRALYEIRARIRLREAKKKAAKTRKKRKGPEPVKRPVEIDKVRSRTKDPVREGVEWLVYEKKFVARKEHGKVRNFQEFLDMRAIDRVKVNGLAFTGSAVWAATDKGVFCYERGSGGWVEYAVNREHFGVEVDSVSADEKGQVTFTMKVDGAKKTYVLDTRASSWSEK
jgi:HEAT repeat protein